MQHIQTNKNGKLKKPRVNSKLQKLSYPSLSWSSVPGDFTLGGKKVRQCR